MLKVLGALLVIGSFTGIGITQRQQFRRRVIALGDMLSALDMISAELSFHLTSIPDIVAKLAADTRSSICGLFQPMQQLMRQDDNLSMTFKWMKSMREYGASVGLTQDDVVILCDLAEFIGKYDVQAQLNSIAYVKTRLTKQLDIASMEMKSKGNVYRTCCVAAGILLVLVLI